MGEWVEHGGGAAFSIAMTDMRHKPSGKKVPQHFLKKGSRAPVTAPPAPMPPTPTESAKPKAPPQSSIRSRIQNYRRDAVPRDKFQDAVVVVPKRPSSQFDAAQYQRQTEEAAEAYRRAKDLDDDAIHLEETAKLEEEENEWDDEPQPQDDEREQQNKQRKHGGALPRREEGSDDDFDERMEFEGRDVRRPPPGRINQNYSRRPLNRQMHEEHYDDELEDVEADDFDSPPPPRRGQGRGRQSGNIDGFKQFLVDKMKELEEEISTYKKENLRLQNITREQEIVLQKLMEEKEDARHQLEADQTVFEQYKEEELKRLRARAKQMEQRAKEAAKVIPKKEREEMEALTGQLEQLREEMRVKDSKARAERERLRKEISDLQLQNTQLQTAAREQQLREINKQFDARAAERRKPASRTSYQKQYEQQLQTQLNEDDSMDEENEGDEEYNDEDRTDPGDHRGLAVQQVANQGRAPPPSSSSFDTTALQTGGKQGHPSSLPGTTDKRRPVASRPASQPVLRKDDPDSEDDPQEDLPGDEVVDSHTYPDNKVQKIYSSGKREIIYTNGTVKKLLPSGHVILHFSNGDIKKTFPSTKIIYYYALAQTTHITYPNGMQVFEFVNQQLEKHYPDGMKEIAFPDGTIKYIYANGTEESIFPTGTASQSALRKMIRSSTHVTVAKSHNLQPHECADDRTAGMF
eukprot:GGOE01044333.1.p1 GENE.GGOE01044333.1~~GGOE01044333.1.p1  ORF type:complete len:704 (-),score=145.80 GGOE01044333.1:444-2516(-)